KLKSGMDKWGRRNEECEMEKLKWERRNGNMKWGRRNEECEMEKTQMGTKKWGTEK
ncbi:hypothetical protein TNCV_972581, partial [Trichonephila clavipes]